MGIEDGKEFGKLEAEPALGEIASKLYELQTSEELGEEDKKIASNVC